MTETRDTDDRHDTTDRARTDARTLGDVSHTHPDTGRSFGANFTFARGGTLVADGGRPDAVPENGDDEEPETLKDVEHTPPNESEDANRVFERGEEARADDGGAANATRGVAEDE